MVGWAAVALFTLFACVMLLWQTRAGPAAQLLAVPGAAALIWIAVPLMLAQRQHAGARVRHGRRWCCSRRGAVRRAGRCNTCRSTSPTRAARRSTAPARAARRISNLASRSTAIRRATIFSFVDLGPRIIVVTHHKAVAGPYHRNGDAILDVQHAFGGSPEQFRAIAARHGASYLLVCPNMAESTIYRARNPGGFYDRLARGETLRTGSIPCRCPQSPTTNSQIDCGMLRRGDQVEAPN